MLSFKPRSCRGFGTFGARVWRFRGRRFNAGRFQGRGLRGGWCRGKCIGGHARPKKLGREKRCLVPGVEALPARQRASPRSAPPEPGRAAARHPVGRPGSWPGGRGSRRTLRGREGGGVCAAGIGTDADGAGPSGSGSGGLGSGNGAALGSSAGDGPAGLPPVGPRPAKSGSATGVPLPVPDRNAISVSSRATATSKACASRLIASSGTGGSRLRNWPKSAARARS